MVRPGCQPRAELQEGLPLIWPAGRMSRPDTFMSRVLHREFSLINSEFADKPYQPNYYYLIIAGYGEKSHPSRT
jgi:hypothetical protein